MRALIFFFLTISFAQATCRSFQRAEELLDTRKFLESSGDRMIRNEQLRRRGLPTEPEEMLPLGDINQARNYVQNFPAFRDLGFPPLSAETWRPHIKRNVGGTAAAGLRDGWRISMNGRAAVVRLDFDPRKGMHYNVEVEDALHRTHKLAVSFPCNGRPCTQADYERIMRSLNR